MASVVAADATEIFEGATGREPLHTLIRLFLVGRPCTVAAFQRALPAVRLDELAAAGIVSRRGDRVVPAVQLLAFAGLLIASSVEPAGRAKLHADHVMGVGMSSITLANLTVRRPVERALDVGCGSGVQALLAARHSGVVVALDRNPRAVRLAMLNLRLNDVGNVHCVVGDLVEPVRGAAFDLITCNPPFVISPDTRYLYRDGGMPGDAVCATIVGTAPRHLRAGGYCQVVCHWAHTEGQGWHERIAEWCAGTGCDVWAMQAEVWDPMTYAATWVGTTEPGSPEETSRTVSRWMRWMQEQGIVAIGTGLITMRRSAGGTTWLRADEVADSIEGLGGEQVLRVFAAQDFLGRMTGDEQLLGARLRVVPEARLDRFYAPGAGAWRGIGTRLRLSTGIRSSATVDAAVAELVGLCDGSRPVAAILDEIAGREGTDRAALIRSALPAVRLLVERGFVVPVEAS
jgi:protein-L-isoaspartate O-methyltransferase